MSDWTEEDSEIYLAIADIAVPRRGEMMSALLAAMPFAREAPLRLVDLGAGDGAFAQTLLDAFPSATILALDGSEAMRRAATARLARFGGRARIGSFQLDTIDWWDRLDGCDVAISSLCLHHLNDSKTQFLYKAVASRLSARGAFLIADQIDPMHPAARRLAADAWDEAARQQAETAGRPELYTRFVQGRWNHLRVPDPVAHPSPLFHHLVWLKHAGFAAVDCFWLFAGHAVFGGFRHVPAPTAQPS